MGPRSFDRGKRSSSSRDSTTGWRFNGAAIFRSRKGQELENYLEKARWLQWGRDLSIAESRVEGYDDPSLARASMGPRSFDRGKQRASGRFKPLQATGFNGAAIFRSRKESRLEGATLIWWRFNGAAIFRSRKAILTTRNAQSRYSLQWGRDLSIAERAVDPNQMVSPTLLQWGRDLSIAERH